MAGRTKQRERESLLIIKRSGVDFGGNLLHFLGSASLGSPFALMAQTGTKANSLRVMLKFLLLETRSEHLLPSFLSCEVTRLERLG